MCFRWNEKNAETNGKFSSFYRSSNWKWAKRNEIINTMTNDNFQLFHVQRFTSLLQIFLPLETEIGRMGGFTIENLIKTNFWCVFQVFTLNICKMCVCLWILRRVKNGHIVKPHQHHLINHFQAPIMSSFYWIWSVWREWMAVKRKIRITRFYRELGWKREKAKGAKKRDNFISIQIFCNSSKHLSNENPFSHQTFCFQTSIIFLGIFFPYIFCPTTITLHCILFPLRKYDKRSSARERGKRKKWKSLGRYTSDLDKSQKITTNLNLKLYFCFASYISEQVSSDAPNRTPKIRVNRASPTAKSCVCFALFRNSNGVGGVVTTAVVSTAHIRIHTVTLQMESKSRACTTAFTPSPSPLSLTYFRVVANFFFVTFSPYPKSFPKYQKLTSLSLSVSFSLPAAGCWSVYENNYTNLISFLHDNVWL